MCRGIARTNKEIAQTLGTNPATTLHHVRQLVGTGFLTAEPPRKGARGAREIPYLATGKSWRIDTPAKDSVLLDTFLEELSLVPIEEVHTTRLGLRFGPGEREKFEQRIQSLFEEYAALPPRVNGEAWSIFYAFHPDPNG